MSSPAEVLAACEGLDVAAFAALPIEDALRAWQVLENANRALGFARATFEQLVAERMPAASPVAVPGAAVFQRHVRKDRIAWDKEALLSAVLDSRLADHQTGEIADETPLQKVLHVWNLAAPRTTALKARDIDADQFCRTERRGYTIEIITS